MLTVKRTSHCLDAAWSAILALLLLLAHPGSAGAQPLEIGVTQSVTLQCGATEELTIAGEAGDYILIHFAEDQDLGGGGVCPACCCFDVRARLFAPSGALVAERTTGIQGNCCNCRSRMIMPALLSETGNYVLELRDQDLFGRGIVAVTAQLLDNPVGESVLTIGASFIVQLDVPGRFETTHIDVAPGTPVAVSMEVQSSGIAPRLALYDRTNCQLLALSDTGQIDGVIAPATGLTLVSYSSLDQTGVYRLSLEATAFCADLNGDGVVGITDFLTLLASWGPCQ